MLSRIRFLSCHEINAYITSPLKFQLGMHLLHTKSEMSEGTSERIMSYEQMLMQWCSLLKIKMKIQPPLTGCCEDLKTETAGSSTGKSNEKTTLRKEKNEACVWSNEGRTGISSAFHFSSFFSLLMQFGSLQSHKYILALCFKLINSGDKRLVF